MNKIVNILEVNSLIETENVANLLKKSVFDKLKVKELFLSDFMLSGFGICKIKTISYFTSEIQIDIFKFSITVRLAEDKFMSHQLIIGFDIIRQSEIVINDSGCEHEM